MDFGPRKNTERDVEEVLEVAKRFKVEDEVEKRRLTEKFDLHVLIEREKHNVCLIFYVKCLKFMSLRLYKRPLHIQRQSQIKPSHYLTR